MPAASLPLLDRITTAKAVLGCALAVLAYFGLMLAISRPGEAVIIGVFRELLTIPFLALWLLGAAAALVMLFRRKVALLYPLATLLLLAATAVLLLGS